MIFSAKFTILVTMLFLTIASKSFAGPDDVTNRLMAEKGSLLDIGILRLQIRLSEVVNLESTSVDYDWDSNEITIRSGSYDNISDREIMNKRCEVWFSSVRVSAGVDLSTGQLYQLLDRSLFADLFTHFGWETTISGKTTSDIIKQVDQKFSLQYYAGSGFANVGQIMSITCTGKLLENGFSIKEERQP